MTSEYMPDYEEVLCKRKQEKQDIWEIIEPEKMELNKQINIWQQPQKRVARVHL